MLPTTKNSPRPQAVLTQLKIVNALKIDDLKSFLDFKSRYYNSPKFIDEDPIQIPNLLLHFVLACPKLETLYPDQVAVAAHQTGCHHSLTNGLNWLSA